MDDCDFLSVVMIARSGQSNSKVQPLEQCVNCHYPGEARACDLGHQANEVFV